MKKSSFTTILLAIVMAQAVFAGTAAEWKKRTVYQVFTDRFWRTDGHTGHCWDLDNYCGGTFKGMTEKLDYIANMGFDAIWISPVIKNTPGGYHGYWAMDLYETNEQFGTKADLKELIDKAHSMGIWVMVDVVANHMGFANPLGDYSKFKPFNQPWHYHDYCRIHPNDFLYDQWRVENCWLEDLPDLKQEDPYVQNQLLKWITWIQKEYKIDGFRIDTIPEVPKWFWPGFQKAANAYCVGECLDSRTEIVAAYQGLVDGMLNYPMYYTINDVWIYGKSAYKIRERWHDLERHFKDVDALGIFVDNHDNQRFLFKQGSHKRLQNALAFTLFSRGIPIVYYGTEQGYAGDHDPKNREQLWTNMDPTSPLYKFVTTAVTYRKKFEVWDLDYTERFVDDHHYFFSRGDIFIATTNSQVKTVSNVTYHPFKEGEVVCNIFYKTDCMTITEKTLKIHLDFGEVKILVRKSDL